MTTSIKTAGANGGGGAVPVESVADILERELQSMIVDWLARVDQEPDLMRIPLTFEERTGHLPRLLQDVIARLRLDTGTKAPISKAAAEHGELRCKQGYTVAMAVEESRLLQVTIFSTLHNNVKNLEFGKLLPDVVIIADEVDAQLKEQMLRFMAGESAKMAKGIVHFWKIMPNASQLFEMGLHGVQVDAMLTACCARKVRKYSTTRRMPASRRSWQSRVRPSRQK
jgi:hypothetical protein